MRIGIDVGGTNTDAALMDGPLVLGACKSPTTSDVGSGIVAVLKQVLSMTGVSVSEIQAVMIGTTHFTNAVVERKRLLEVAAIRLGLPATKALPPMTDWPKDLADTLGRHTFMVRGGNEFDGRKIAPLDEPEILRIAGEIRSRGLKAASITSVFSPVTPDMELRAAEILGNEIPGLSISLSHEVGRVGFLERENASVMNASLADLSRKVVNSFRNALKELAINAPFYISQNDGTLMVPDYVERYPVLTFASGPTNSMRGAAMLAGEKEAMVVDIGGTTSDVGMLMQGFPRESAVAVDIGGVRTNFRMPDVLAIGLGGGSIVRDDGARIGPDSVGYEITSRALIFGGDTLTTTDIIVAAGLEDIGDRSRVAHIPARTIKTALDTIHRMADEAVDRMKTSAEPLPVILVGGGSILISRDLPSASRVIRPENASVANAIGAAIAQVGGEVDRIFSLEGTSRDIVLGGAKKEAEERAVKAGAEAGTVKIMDIEEVPLAYLPGSATRIRVKAIGDLVIG
ncbi:hydantoinase/oxoprolinase N-terminal domain-containing protein (plasmid) [Rhizobium leguminosarum]|uniref:Hydantoinase/oxoprolinase family protein n=1 Tax=Rhizobium leguminosarum TaxID=384 RepID=A0A2Z4YQI8_RHILE|nr:hydantoinase/oxoprolinase family protein [Rhizobium leguminosarum]ASS58648.1 hydantoinase subunit beta [Rhizobium leguminosarum bv. viciae]AXA42513.1 Hydantoinase/oxoprolinase family protein [Rhizobium leguminosarum]MBB4333073.1 N-methylhydantoinase A/oxoprolinase/acetone carboxylase beta subunit [Rhizobium leguminosarum]MBB4342837.1 N-methylhydantoinase A/oxoprolinase/acetone carboxylase beta subunit [Rhizobium leguminosarum]MBB4358757.1 N-methylhydantoinase A/oxoprolinase/acetone carboxyl